jgi:hypothetical protein
MGVEQGFCSDLYCENHDGIHQDDMDEHEKYLKKYEGNYDFCWAVVHVYAGVNG